MPGIMSYEEWGDFVGSHSREEIKAESAKTR